MFKTPKSQLVFIVISTLLAGFSLASIVDFTDPFASSAIVKMFFYVSLFLLCLGLFTIIGLFLRQWLWPKLYVINLGHSFRQAVLVAILISVSLGIAAARLMFWWVELSLILFLASVEAFMNLKL